jgi:hypothetical protein
MNDFPFNGLELSLSGGSSKFLLIKQDGRVKAAVKGRRQAKRAVEILHVLKNKNIAGERLDDRFFSVLSLYLCEEKYMNSALLQNEIRRFL